MIPPGNEITKFSDTGNRSRESISDCVALLSKEYSENTIRAALIQHWALDNNMPLARLERGAITGDFLLFANPGDAAKALARLQQKLPAFSLKDLETAFESLMNPEQRKSLGAVYTPNFIIDNLLHHGLALGWHDHRQPPSICDPCCGSAGFLIRAAKKLQQHGIGLEQAFSECLIGFDRDTWILNYARCLIELYLASHHIPLPGPFLRLYSADILLAEVAEVWRTAGVPQGFDVIATNPPYVKLQNLTPEYRADLSQRYAAYARGNFSLSPLFLIAGHQMLSKQGCLAVITQNNLFTSLSGVEVRRYLQQQQCLRRILTFGSQQIFHNASAYTCLLFLGGGKQATFEYGSVTNSANAQTLAAASFNIITNQELKPEKWRLADKAHLAALKRIEATGTPLGMLTDIRVGFATLKDKVFLVRQEGERCVTNAFDGIFYEVENDVTRAMVKIADLNTVSDLQNNNRRVIFPYKRVEGKYRLLPEGELRTCYPKAYQYLSARRDLLGSRDKGNKNYEGWYAWGRTQGMEGRGPKLLTKTFSRQPNFLLDASDQLFCNGYAVFPHQRSLLSPGYAIEVLERILNSRIMYYYARLTSFEIQGNFQCYQKNFIERLGIAEMGDSQTKELLELPLEEVDAYLANLYCIPLAQINDFLAEVDLVSEQDDAPDVSE